MQSNKSLVTRGRSPVNSIDWKILAMCLRRLEMEPDVLSKSSAADIAKLKQKRPTAYSMELHDWVRNQQDKHFFGDMLNSEMAMSRINFGIPLLLAELHELGVEPER